METPSITPQSSETPTEEQATSPEVIINVYPVMRHIFLFACVVLTLAIIIFLTYQNGKSIYDKGL